MNELRDIGTVPYSLDTFRLRIEAMQPLAELLTLLVIFAALIFVCHKLLRLISAALDRFGA